MTENSLAIRLDHTIYKQVFVSLCNGYRLPQHSSLHLQDIIMISRKNSITKKWLLTVS